MQWRSALLKIDFDDAGDFLAGGKGFPDALFVDECEAAIILALNPVGFLHDRRFRWSDRLVQEFGVGIHQIILSRAK